MSSNICRSLAEPLDLYDEFREWPHYAIQVRYRHERIVEQSLRLRGYRPFVAVYKNRRRWSDRITEIETPVFPGYVFCAFDVKKRLPILTTPGVLGIVGTGKVPVAIDPQELEAVRNILVSGVEIEPCVMAPGQKVRIETGPLRGVEGVLLHGRGKNRLLVSISLLHRSISAIIESDEAAALRT